jgi:hypothetical protein
MHPPNVTKDTTSSKTLGSAFRDSAVVGAMAITDLASLILLVR